MSPQPFVDFLQVVFVDVGDDKGVYPTTLFFPPAKASLAAGVIEMWYAQRRGTEVLVPRLSRHRLFRMRPEDAATMRRARAETRAPQRSRDLVFSMLAAEFVAQSALQKGAI